MRRLILKFRRRRRLERDLETELAFHEQMAQASGSVIGLGNTARVKEDARDVWRWHFVEDAWRDARHAIRRLCQAPTFTIAAVLTLALAIGANTAIFTLVQRVILNPLPYPDSDRVIDLDHAAPGANFPRGLGLTPGLYFHYRERARTLEEIALYNFSEATLTGRGRPERIPASVVTPGLGTVLRIAPAHGRWFAEKDADPTAPLVAVLSHELWMRRFGGTPDALGQTASVDGMAAEIVGVMPPSFAFPGPDVELWLPLQSARRMAWGPFSGAGVARLVDGVSVDDARTELTNLIKGLPAEYPDDPGVTGLVEDAGLISVARPLKARVIGNITDVLWMLLASVGFVLLVACANVANLFLVRSETRQHELAVRRALGASRPAVARYFAAESILISAGGAISGLAIAWGAVRLLARFGPANLPRLAEVRLDPTVILFVAVLGLITAGVLGAVPLLGAGPAASSVQERGRGNTTGARRHRTRHVLMAAQVALTLILFVAAGLMIRSFQNLRAIDPGFDPSSALTFRIGLPLNEYPDTAASVRGHYAILDALSAVPGVVGASASTRIPLAGTDRGFSSDMRVEGRLVPDGTIPPIVAFRAVAGGYFETMRMAVLSGRGIASSDVERAEFVAVANEALVATYFPDRDPIGMRVARGTGPVNSDWLTIVGVVANTPFNALPEATPSAASPELYIPMSISGPPDGPDKAANGPAIGDMSYVVRSALPSLALRESLSLAIDTVDANLAMAEVRTLQSLVDDASRQTAFTMALVVIAAAVALMLGLVGIYGVVAYIVRQRTNEIGIRMALGADPRGVAARIVLQSGIVTIVGITAGLAVALAGGRFIESLLYGVSPGDPEILIVAASALLGVVILACWLPARHASRIDPTDALRAD